jgi:UDP-4-amino-4,6-dideoxy-N-acetyl-beta-L-altrosamine transaminase
MRFIPYGLHWIDELDIEEVVKVLRSDWIVMGNKVKEFEHAVCSYVGAKHGVAVNSGTAALDVAVNSLGLGDGEVITTPLTFVATAHAILYAGLRPVFADIQRDTFNIDPSDIERKITEKTRAVIYVDFAGHPCDIDEIRKIAGEHGLRMVEDAAHALGAEYRGRKVGSLADVTIFSFHPVKHITTGEGGMCVTSDDELAQRMRILRNHGIESSAIERFGPRGKWVYDVKMLGRNYRMTDFQAALGLSQLNRLEFFIKRREEIAKAYIEELSGVDGIELPAVKPYIRHAWHIFTILVDRKINRDKFIESLRKKGIGAAVHYPPIYSFTYYRERFGLRPEDFPVSEDVSSRTVTIPLFPRMSNEEVEIVVKVLKETAKKLRR